MGRRIRFALFVAVVFLAPWAADAQNLAGPPLLTAAQVGSTVEGVSVETYGVLRPATVRRYLSVKPGMRLYQGAIDHDYANLSRLGAYQTRLNVEDGTAAGTVRLRWIVQSKWVKPTDHPFYRDAPLTASIQGVGFILTAPPMDLHGGNFSAYTQLSKRANLARVLYTEPLTVNPNSGVATSAIVDTFGGRGVFRASEPEAVNVYSWTAGEEALFLTQRDNGSQFETGIRVAHTSNELSSNLVAPSLYPTNVSWARTTQLLAGLTHGCTVPATRWYPPFCDMQYRFSVTDAIGGLGATSTYQVYSGDMARYVAVGASTLAVHASAVRSGGVVPDSFLVCATVRGYPKSFCGTDAEGVTAEYRINDQKDPKMEFVVFTETAASRVRQSANSYATPYFTWHPDTGVGVMFHLIRIDVADGKDGMRLTFELRGQTF
jgi:hypothetical protein